MKYPRIDNVSEVHEVKLILGNVKHVVKALKVNVKVPNKLNTIKTRFTPIKPSKKSKID